MSVSNSISRLADYYKRHGLAASLRRAGLAGKRALFAGRMVVFYCDLGDGRLSQASIPIGLRIEGIRTLTQLSAEQLHAMTSFWNPNLANQNIRERFGKGALLWLAELDGRLAGFGWTLQGGAIESYYFPLAQDDVHLFDFHVFPEYRGRGVNPYLIGRILELLATNCTGRAFIEAAEWNHAQLSSLRKTPFRCLGSAKSFTFLGHTFVSWYGSDGVSERYNGTEPTDKVLRTANSNEQ